MKEKQEATLNFVLFWLFAIGFFAGIYYNNLVNNSVYLTLICSFSGIGFLFELFNVIINALTIHELKSIKNGPDRKNGLLYILLEPGIKELEKSSK